MRFQLVDANKADMPVERMCTLLDVSVSGFYAWKSRVPCQRQLDDMIVLAHIRAQFATSHQTYGVPRMFEELRVNIAAEVCAGRLFRYIPFFRIACKKPVFGAR